MSVLLKSAPASVFTLCIASFVELSISLSGSSRSHRTPKIQFERLVCCVRNFYFTEPLLRFCQFASCLCDFGFRHSVFQWLTELLENINAYEIIFD